MILIPNEQIILIPHANQVYLIAYNHARPNMTNVARSLNIVGLGLFRTWKGDRSIRIKQTIVILSAWMQKERGGAWS